MDLSCPLSVEESHKGGAAAQDGSAHPSSRLAAVAAAAAGALARASQGGGTLSAPQWLASTLGLSNAPKSPKFSTSLRSPMPSQAQLALPAAAGSPSSSKGQQQQGQGLGSRQDTRETGMGSRQITAEDLSGGPEQALAQQAPRGLSAAVPRALPEEVGGRSGIRWQEWHGMRGGGALRSA